MFSLDTLAQAVPASRLGGRFGVEVLGLLYPIRSEVSGRGIRLLAFSDLSRPLDPEELFQRSSPSQGSLASLRDHVLVVCPSGEFFSTDELALLHMRREHDQWSIDLEITHYQNPNLDPEPRDLCIVLSIDAGNRPFRSLVLQFSGRWRDYQGNETPMPKPVAPNQVIEFSD
jgi:hypothetical protein